MLNRYTLLLAIGLAVSILFGVVIGLLARRKGYSFTAWFGAGGMVIPAAIALGFLPDSRDAALDAADRSAMIRRGNCWGICLSLVTVLLSLLPFAVRLFWLASAAQEQGLGFSQGYGDLAQTGQQALNWYEFLTIVLTLMAYISRPRGTKSPLVVISLCVLILLEGYTIFAQTFLNTWLFPQIPAEMLHACHFTLYLVRYVAFAGLFISLATLPTNVPSALRPEQS